MTNNPVQHARDALAGRIEVEPPTTICSVCDREIDANTAWAIPAIGFMCPRGTKDCKPQRSIWDEVREQEAKDKQRRIDAIKETILDACAEALYQDSTRWLDLTPWAEKVYEIALDPTRIIEGTR